jgi:phospho-N-acetylmuramoyl-pentapeptide-transferase
MKETSLALTLSAFTFILAVIWGGPLLRLLRQLKIGKLIRVEEPDAHITKMGTPTMGGVMIILPVIFVTFLLNAASLIGLNVYGQSIILPSVVMVAFGLLGAIDDWEGIRGPRRGSGMRIRTKFLLQTILALGAAVSLQYLLNVPHLHWPGAKHPLDLGIWFVPIAMFIIVAMANAVNFTDGMDGLAGLISATCFAAYGVIALMAGQVFIARFCFTLVGAIFGFLWFNVHPAQLFMGDTGSLAIGATLAYIALMTGQWLALPLIAIIPVSEAVSDVLQIAYFRMTGGKRLFKMAPLHLHFELLGWSETQVVQRFWLVALMSAMIGIAFTLV